MAKWIENLNQESPGLIAVLNVVFHSNLLQFTQLYESLPGYKQWYVHK